ncbi:MAG: tripartite tricarboxylate transporter permease [Stomatobaculum sp.]|nr:tripartite tricarboxylate transporter permease [Stomatobaculum sp.]
MTNLSMFGTAMAQILTDPKVLLLLAISVACGIVIGALPGLTATMGVALMVPFTYGMEMKYGLPVLMGIYCSAVYGGSISAILLNTPGTPAAAATVIDGYPMAKNGQAGRALSMSVFASTVGGLIGVAAMILFAPAMSKIALHFTSGEFAVIALFGLSVIVSISGDSLLKGFISAGLGLMLCSIGLDPMDGYPRFTFGSMNLYSGFELVPVLIGLFAVSECLISIENIEHAKTVKSKVERILSPMSDIRQCFVHIVKSGVLGTFIGCIPGAGSDIACFVAYGEAKRSSKNAAEFGKGSIEGVAAPESANNAVGGGAMIPMLSLGVPGDPVTAVLIGALMIQGLTPGPLLYRDHADVVFLIFASMVVANIFMFIIASAGLPVFTKVVSIDKNILVPVIFILCMVGSFSLRNNVFDVWTAFGFGVAGYLLQKVKLPVAPILLALILGPMAEENLRRMLVANDGSYMALTSPICLVLFALSIFMVVSSLRKQKQLKAKEAAAKAAEKEQ